MNIASTCRASIALSALLALTFGGASTAASGGVIDLEPPVSACAALSLRVDQAPLSAVLARLASELHFSLRYEAADDPLVSYAGRAKPEQVVAQLLRGRSAGISTEADRQCPQQRRIAKIWIMPRGGERPPQPVAATVPTPEQAAGLAIYRKAHGLDADGNPPSR